MLMLRELLQLTELLDITVNVIYPSTSTLAIDYYIPGLLQAKRHSYTITIEEPSTPWRDNVAMLAQ